jgi:hypothetical protein
MSGMDDLIAFLRARIDEDEQVAREASRATHGDSSTPTGEHWHWVESEHDQPMTLDPMLDEYVNDGSQVALRSVEQYPTSSPWTLPHMVVSYAEEVRTTDATHIARWDPARVLAEVEAKRRIIAGRETWHDEQRRAGEDYQAWAEGRAPEKPPARTLAENLGPGLELAVRLLALSYASHPDYREEWRP